MRKKTKFQKELEKLINRYSIEQGSNTPDYILAEYLVDCLDSFARAVNTREGWYGRSNTPDESPCFEVENGSPARPYTSNLSEGKQ